MTEDIYQAIKSTLEEARGDRYPRLARLLGPIEPHLLVNYEGSDRVKAGDALAKEKERHDKITAALDWLETQKPEVSTDATQEGLESPDDIPEHTGDGESGAPAETSGSGSAIDREENEQENETTWQK